MKDLNPSINDAPKRYVALADIGQYVEVKSGSRNQATIMVKVDAITGEKFIGTVKLIHGQVEGLRVNDKVRFPISSAVRCYDEAMKLL